MGGSSDGGDKFTNVLVIHVHKKSGLTATSLLGMQNINSVSTEQEMYDVCNEQKHFHWTGIIL